MDRRSEGRSCTLGARRGAVFLACASVALTLCVVASSADSASAPSFARTRSYTTGANAQSVAIGDLNGDGKADLVTASPEAHAVSVLINRGDASFQAKVDYGLGSFTYPASVAISDLNGDGKPDLATANSGNGDFIGTTVSVLLNRGDGSFHASVDYDTARQPRSVAIGDLNGDGKPDLVTVNAFVRDAGTISVLLNSGDGSFGTKVEYPSERATSVAIGDLNGDGKSDLATSNSERGSVSVFLNRGDGNFEARLDYPAGLLSPYTVAIGDLNGDGEPDLAILDILTSRVSVLANRGDGSFSRPVSYRVGGGDGRSVAIGDLNRDTKPDLATTSADADTISVLANKGDGTFQGRVDYRAGVGLASVSPVSVAIGDLNRDGKPDVATANDISNTVSVLINTPGLCTVQNVKGQALQSAKRTIARANCRGGKIYRAYSKRVKRGRVISQKPRFGAVRPGGSKVSLVISRGRRR